MAFVRASLSKNHYAESDVPAEEEEEGASPWFSQADAQEFRKDRPEAPQGQGPQAPHRREQVKKDRKAPA